MIDCKNRDSFHVEVSDFPGRQKDAAVLIKRLEKLQRSTWKNIAGKLSRGSVLIQRRKMFTKHDFEEFLSKYL